MNLDAWKLVFWKAAKATAGAFVAYLIVALLAQPSSPEIILLVGILRGLEEYGRQEGWYP